MRFIALLIVSALLPTLVSAQVAAPSICAATPRITTVNYPGAQLIPPSNDLTRFNGKAVSADGQLLMIELRLRDTRCVPIQGAVIELWQADPFGKWRLATREDRVNPNPVFSGAGRTYTDNNGGAWFITVFPAAIKDQAPRLQLRVEAPYMQPFDTMLYFAGDVRNDTDPAYKKLAPETRRRVELSMTPLANDANAGFAGAAEIILPGTARYRTY